MKAGVALILVGVCLGVLLTKVTETIRECRALSDAVLRSKDANDVLQSRLNELQKTLEQKKTKP